MNTTALASIGDHGVLNTSLSKELSDIWIDRDLSWLDFNQRVLSEALDERTPLLERAKFLAIFTSNLDEFFMKRVSVLRQGAGTGPRALLQQLREKLLPMLRAQADCYRKTLVPGLAKYGIVMRRWDDLTNGQREEACDYFDSSVSAALTPLVIDPTHPFPFLSNLSTSLAFRLQELEEVEFSYARVKIPTVLTNWVPLNADLEPGQKLFVPLYEVIRGNMHKLYGGMTITGMTLLRITRDAEVEMDDDPEAGIRELVQEQIRQRRYEPIVRLEFGPDADPAIKENLRERFKLSSSDVYDMAEEVDYTTLFEIAGLPFPELRDRPWTPLQHPSLPEEGSIFAAIRAATCLSIIPTKASTEASNTSSALRPMIRRQFLSK
jgi:polyphosphate kinase